MGYNVGGLMSGGNVVNAIPAEVTFSVDLRTVDPQEDQVAPSAKQALRHPHHLAGRRAMNEPVLFETGRAVGGGRYGPLAPERDVEDRIGRLTEARPMPTRGG